MQQQIKWVLWLILFFIVLINSLQVVWIYNVYKEQNKQYKRLLTNCLANAVSYYHLHQIKSTKNNSAKFYIISGIENVQHRFTDTEKKQLIFSSSDNILFDSISGKLGHSQLIQMQYRDTLFIHLLDSLFQLELEKNNIKTPYILKTKDTFKAPEQFLPYERMDSLVPTKMNYSPDADGYSVKTAGMLVNIYGKQVVYAVFKPYPQFLFRKMLGMITLSFVLFTILNIALVYVFKTIRRQKKISEIKNDFINNMTHELRTPITIASSALEALLHHHGLEDQQKTTRYLQTSKEELVYLDQLVEKILNIAIEEKEDILFNYEGFNLKQLFSNIIKNHILIHQSKVSFHLDLENFEEDVYLDRLHFSNAINNIIDNAIKYADGDVKIDITGFKDQNALHFTIKDNGPGIAKEHQAAVFEPFYRVSTGDLHNVKGFGLGLSYVKKIIMKHGGSIKLESKEGKGTTLMITIPMNLNHGK